MSTKTWIERYEIALARLKQFQLEAETDCSFDKEHMETNFNVTMAIQKWHGKRIDWTDTNKKLKSKLRQITRQRFEFYKKEFSMKLDNKYEMELFIFSDKEYIEVDNLYTLTNDILLFINNTIDNLKGKGFEIKRWIDWQNFINGK